MSSQESSEEREPSEEVEKQAIYKPSSPKKKTVSPKNKKHIKFEKSEIRIDLNSNESDKVNDTRLRFKLNSNEPDKVNDTKFELNSNESDKVNDTKFKLIFDGRVSFDNNGDRRVSFDEMSKEESISTHVTGVSEPSAPAGSSPSGPGPSGPRSSEVFAPPDRTKGLTSTGRKSDMNGIKSGDDNRIGSDNSTGTPDISVPLSIVVDHPLHAHHPHRDHHRHHHRHHHHQSEHHHHDHKHADTTNSVTSSSVTKSDVRNNRHCLNKTKRGRTFIPFSRPGRPDRKSPQKVKLKGSSIHEEVDNSLDPITSPNMFAMSLRSDTHKEKSNTAFKSAKISSVQIHDPHHSDHHSKLDFHHEKPRIAGLQTKPNMFQKAGLGGKSSPLKETGDDSTTADGCGEGRHRELIRRTGRVRDRDEMMEDLIRELYDNWNETVMLEKIKNENIRNTELMNLIFPQIEEDYRMHRRSQILVDKQIHTDPPDVDQLDQPDSDKVGQEVGQKRGNLGQEFRKNQGEHYEDYSADHEAYYDDHNNMEKNDEQIHSRNFANQKEYNCAKLVERAHHLNPHHEWRWDVRIFIWNLMENNDTVRGLYRPCHFRIPMFAENEKAITNLNELKEFKQAKCVFCPTMPGTQKIIQTILLAGHYANARMKNLIVPLGGYVKGGATSLLRDYDSSCLFGRVDAGCFNSKTQWDIVHYLATPKGIRNHGYHLRLEECKAVKVDLVIMPSVAVDPITGFRLGQGRHDLSELHYGAMRELGMITKDTPVVTIVHNDQILHMPRKRIVFPHDVHADIIVTPSGCARVKKKMQLQPQPLGVYWNLVHKDKLEDMRAFKKLKRYLEKQIYDWSHMEKFIIENADFFAKYPTWRPGRTVITDHVIQHYGNHGHHHKDEHSAGGHSSHSPHSQGHSPHGRHSRHRHSIQRGSPPKDTTTRSVKYSTRTTRKAATNTGLSRDTVSRMKQSNSVGALMGPISDKSSHGGHGAKHTKSHSAHGGRGHSADASRGLGRALSASRSRMESHSSDSSRNRSPTGELAFSKGRVDVKLISSRGKVRKSHASSRKELRSLSPKSSKSSDSGRGSLKSSSKKGRKRLASRDVEDRDDSEQYTEEEELEPPEILDRTILRIFKEAPSLPLKKPVLTSLPMVRTSSGKWRKFELAKPVHECEEEVQVRLRFQCQPLFYSSATMWEEQSREQKRDFIDTKVSNIVSQSRVEELSRRFPLTFPREKWRLRKLDADERYEGYAGYYDHEDLDHDDHDREHNLRNHDSEGDHAENRIDDQESKTAENRIDDQESETAENRIDDQESKTAETRIDDQESKTAENRIDDQESKTAENRIDDQESKNAVRFEESASVSAAQKNAFQKTAARETARPSIRNTGRKSLASPGGERNSYSPGRSTLGESKRPMYPDVFLHPGHHQLSDNYEKLVSEGSPKRSKPGNAKFKEQSLNRIQDAKRELEGWREQRLRKRESRQRIDFTIAADTLEKREKLRKTQASRAYSHEAARIARLRGKFERDKPIVISKDLLKKILTRDNIYHCNLQSTTN